jgi:hypothetical protein
MGWDQVLDGLVGGAVGVLGSFGIAVYVVRSGARSALSQRKATAAEIGLGVLSWMSNEMSSARGAGTGEERYSEAHQRVTSRCAELAAIIGGLSDDIDTELRAFIELVRLGNYTDKEERNPVWARSERNNMAINKACSLMRLTTKVMLDAK